MGLSICKFVLIVLLSASTTTAAEPAKPVVATIETTLATAQKQIRQFAFDGDSNTFFASENNPSSSDHFTLLFEQPVTVKSIAVVTGQPDGGDALEAGKLEFSADGKTFRELALFVDGKAQAEPRGQQVRAIRIQPTATSRHPLAIRELTIESEPPVAVFKYPVEVIVDATDEPKMKDWAENVAKVCTRAYPMINEELKSDGFKPPRVVTLTLKNDYRGVAETSDNEITGSVKYFQEHPGDAGAIVHETVHVVQHYRGGGNPGWLVEGVSDYIRFFKFEPGKIGRINANRARYNGGYRASAAFLAYLTDKYDKQLVLKLNKLMREGHYKKDIFQVLTGKSLEDLGKEWLATLKS
jgi:hypothetical protein